MSTRSMSRNALFAALGLALAAGTLLAPGLQAEAAESGASSAPSNTPSAQLMARQDALLDAAKSIRTIADQDPRSNFSGIELTVEKSVLDLYWKGAAPAEVQSLITRVNAEGKSTIRLHPADFSLAELNREVKQVMAQPDTSFGKATRAAPLHDGSGLNVAVDGTGAPLGSRAHKQLAPSAASGIDTKVPVTLEVAPEATPVDRIDDGSPYWGGALMINRSGSNACTAAFGVKRNSDGATRVLTAAHCGKTGDEWVDGGYDVMGKVEGNWPTYETQLINTRGGTSVWHGSVRADHTSGSDATNKTVRGWAFPEVGQLVCSSGSFSGSRCVIKVTHNNVTLNLGGGLIVPGMVQAEQQGRTNAAGNGDSGGPVYGVRSDGGATASGIISAIDLSTSVTCTGVPAGGGRSCAWRMFYVNIQNAMNVSKTTINMG
ncbi:S1 family peptidase [Streptomyces sp. NPDC057552]|uniref:S1 family peptidase n=1 Tax=Streptomyces sp. NPDC057552 TaxID=3350537 RepID=UPI0036874505